MDNTQLQQQIISLEQRISDLEKKIGKTNQDKLPEKKMSLREFLIEKKPSDDVKKTLAIGYFLEKFGNYSSINTNDLKKGYEKAKEKKPKNVNDKVNMNIKNGHMEEAAEKKEKKKSWYITNSGVIFVENDFNKSK